MASPSLWALIGRPVADGHHVLAWFGSIPLKRKRLMRMALDEWGNPVVAVLLQEDWDMSKPSDNQIDLTEVIAQDDEIREVRNGVDGSLIRMLDDTELVGALMEDEQVCDIPMFNAHDPLYRDDDEAEEEPLSVHDLRHPDYVDPDYDGTNYNPNIPGSGEDE